MQLLQPDVRIDFLRHRRTFLIASGVLALASAVGLFFPGPRLGLDLGGGSELELALSRPIPTAELRKTVSELGFPRAEVVEIAGGKRVLIRMGTADGQAERSQGESSELLKGLQRELGTRSPELVRMEWVGPSASEQLRESTGQALVYATGLIMAYVAFRFDLRFAPGAVVALVHDALITAGVYVAMRKEMTLSTVAALLTVVGYSINDTIVVYDRIRENSARVRGMRLYDLINLSVSQTLSRTIITSGTTLLSIVGFFYWGTPMLQDIAFALFVGFSLGTYSTVYVASAVTELIDRRFEPRKGASHASMARHTSR